MEGKNAVHNAGGDRALRHAVKLCLVWILHKDEPALDLDLAQAKGSVRTRPGKHHTDGVAIMRGGKRTKEVVNRRALTPVFLKLGKAQVRVNGAQVGVGRDHVDVVRLDPNRFSHLLHRKADAGLKKVGHQALVLRRKVNHDNKGQPAVRRDVPKQLLERGQASGGRANADNRRLIRTLGGRHLFPSALQTRPR